MSPGEWIAFGYLVTVLAVVAVFVYAALPPRRPKSPPPPWLPCELQPPRRRKRRRGCEAKRYEHWEDWS